MPGQPTDFSVHTVIPTEDGAPLVPPLSIVEEGDSLKLRAYFHCGVSALAQPIVSSALTGAGAKVEYFFQDLQAGGNPIKVSGGAITGPLTPAQINTDPEAPVFPPGDVYRSADTAAITTGAAGMLKIPAGSRAGTWRVLTLITGGGGGPIAVSAFADTLIVQVVTP